MDDGNERHEPSCKHWRENEEVDAAYGDESDEEGDDDDDGEEG